MATQCRRDAPGWALPLGPLLNEVMRRTTPTAYKSAQHATRVGQVRPEQRVTGYDTVTRALLTSREAVYEREAD